MTRWIIAAMAVLMAGAGTGGLHLPPRALPPCPDEDSATVCYWDAQHRGNGLGRAFWVDERGHAHHL